MKDKRQRLIDSLLPSSVDIDALHQQLSNPNLRSIALEEIKLALSTKDQSIACHASEKGMVNTLLGLLSLDLPPEDVVNIFWCINNLVFATDVSAIPIFKSLGALLSYGSHPNPLIQEVSLWAFGNLAGDSPMMRSSMRSQELLPILSNALQSPHLDVVRSATFAYCNLVRGGWVGFPTYQPLPAILKACESLQNETGTTLRDLLWLLSFVSAYNELRKECCAPICIQIALRSLSNNQNIVPSLRFLGNVALDDDFSLQLIQEQGFIRVCMQLLEGQPHHETIQELCFLCSNIAGSNDQTLALFCESPILPRFIALFPNTPFRAAIETGYLFLTISPYPGILHRLAHNQDVIYRFLGFLRLHNTNSNQMALDFIEMVLKGVENGPHIIEECDGIAALEELQAGSQSQELSRRAYALVDDFYGCDD